MFEKENLPPLYISDWLNLSLNIDRMTSPVGHPCDKSLSAGDAILQPENHQSARPI